nr:hypothetical protein CFP56_54408 [Quercus suber]
MRRDQLLRSRRSRDRCCRSWTLGGFCSARWARSHLTQIVARVAHLQEHGPGMLAMHFRLDQRNIGGHRSGTDIHVTDMCDDAWSRASMVLASDHASSTRVPLNWCSSHFGIRIAELGQRMNSQCKGIVA